MSSSSRTLSRLGPHALGADPRLFNSPRRSIAASRAHERKWASLLGKHSSYPFGSVHGL
jgi:hypothetical protein